MVERIRARKQEGGGGNYFSAPKTSIQFIPTGCKTLDLALGGGWAEARIANIVGDKSTGKTLLAIEACANFANKYPKGMIRYREAESAFDRPYAGALGMPLNRIDFGDGQLETVEDFFEDLTKTIDGAKGPELYILDSLDALSDRAEMGRDMDAGSYGAEKAKKLSQLFRRLVRKLSASSVTVIIISQIRDKMNAMAFAKKTTRAGGRALDFYASQVLFLSQTGTLSKVVSGIKRPIGIAVQGKVEKNKVALPMREAHFNLLFGYGIDDAMACLEWLKECKSLKEINVAEKGIGTYCASLMRIEHAEYVKTMKTIHEIVERRWYEIERSFMPTKRKYGG